MHSVIIIGAGPSGLAAARIFQKCFKVTVLEKSHHLGGIWNSLEPSQFANLSKFTVSFSDLSWSNEDVVKACGHVPSYPRAWQVRRYLDVYARDVAVRYNCNVTRVERRDKRFEVEWSAEERTESVMVDHVIVASGFFSSPRPWPMAIHSSQLRAGDVDGNVTVVGGGISGVEAASNLAFHFSSLAWSGPERPIPTVTHVVSRPFYDVPPMVPYGSGFAPADLCWYDLANRPDPIEPLIGKRPVERNEAAHENLGSLGRRHLEVDTSRPPVVTFSEYYTGFVRSGAIKLVQHAVTVDTVVNATGYVPVISYLSEELKSDLDYDADATKMPLLLDEYSTLRHDVPGLGFVGFYQGPYFGIIEMQARLLLKTWTEARVPTQTISLADLRESMKRNDPNVPQFWMGDYTGIMDKMARILGIKRNDMVGPVLAARYGQGHEATKALEDVKQMLLDVENGKFTARATFHALQGEWKIRRTLKSKISTFPSGVLVGKATFHPRRPTGDYHSEYLYVEEGVLDTGTMTMNATRRYVYRYDEADVLSVWFVKDDGVTVDYLYHELKFHGHSATADHLCVADMYKTEYEFEFGGVDLGGFEVVHVVEGPRKDYTSVTVYAR